jgi:lysophospholipase L1-like esterase
MSRKLALLVGCAAVAIACGESPTGPTIRAARTPRLSRTRFLAFGDSLTSGEVTAPNASQLPESDSAPTSLISKLVVVPNASYPAVLLSDLRASYPAQAGAITMSNQGKAAETIFEGVRRFAGVFAANRPEVVLLQEGVSGLGFEGPDGSTALMRSMVQLAKDGGARVFVGSMIPTLPNRQRSQNASLLEAYNDVLKVMCTQEGVTYVDLYNGIMPQADQWVGADGLHPNEAGYRHIAELFFTAIRNELEER